MKTVKNRIGQRFGKLLVLEYVDTINKRAKWLCRCDCGKETIVLAHNLVSGNTKSCGCSEGYIKHRLSYTKEYVRVTNVKNKELKKKLDSGWTLEMDWCLKEFQPSCVICESIQNLSVDHVKPISKGNPLLPGNAVVLCRKCNSLKNNKNLNDLSMEWKTILIRESFFFLIHWNEVKDSYILLPF